MSKEIPCQISHIYSVCLYNFGCWILIIVTLTNFICLLLFFLNSFVNITEQYKNIIQISPAVKPGLINRLPWKCPLVDSSKSLGFVRVFLSPICNLPWSLKEKNTFFILYILLTYYHPDNALNLPLDVIQYSIVVIIIYIWNLYKEFEPVAVKGLILEFVSIIKIWSEDLPILFFFQISFKIRC